MMHHTLTALTSLLLAQWEDGWVDSNGAASVDHASSSTAALSDTGAAPSGLLADALRERLDFLCHPETLKELLLNIHIVWAGIFIALGLFSVIHGWRWRKVTVVALAAIAGMWGASQVAGGAQGAQIMAAAVAVITGIVAWPFMRYAAALFGGLAGAFAGANIWTAIGQAPEQHYVGALIGFVFVCMLALTAFRSVIIALTTVVGATMLVMGSLAALLTIDMWRDGLLETINDTPLLVPILTGAVIVVGAVMQYGGGLKGLNTMADRAHAPIEKKPVEAKAH